MITPLRFKQFLNRHLVLGRWMDEFARSHRYDNQNLFFKAEHPELWIMNAFRWTSLHWHHLHYRWQIEVRYGIPLRHDS